MKKIRILLLAFSLCFIESVNAVTCNLSEFKTICNETKTTIARFLDKECEPDRAAYTAAKQLAAINYIRDETGFMTNLDLKWIVACLEAIQNENDFTTRRRKVNRLYDTLSLLEEGVSETYNEKVSREEMENALLRADSVAELPSGRLLISESKNGGMSANVTPLYEAQPVDPASFSIINAAGRSDFKRDNVVQISRSVRKSSQALHSSPGISSLTSKSRQSEPKQPEPPKSTSPKTDRPPEHKLDDIWGRSYVLAIVLFIGITIVVLWAVHRAWGRTADSHGSDGASRNSTFGEERIYAGDLFQMAEKAANENRLEEAVSLLMKACFFLLEEKSVLNFQETMTNGEYLANLAKSRAFYDSLREPIRCFDSVVYGLKKAEYADYDLLKKTFLKLGGLN